MKVLEYILGLVFPPKCIFCGSILDLGSELHICDSCYKKIDFIGDICWRPAGTDWEQSCDAVVSVCRYNGIVKHSLIKYKFYNKPGYYRTFARLLAKYIFMVTNSTKFDIIISVPLHKSREAKRGYNQARLISRALSGITGIRDASGLLVRVRNTNAQSLLDRRNRHENIRDAFSVTKDSLVKGKNILLIDDIMTTGSTINECAKTLKKAGARTVAAAVIATGQVF